MGKSGIDLIDLSVEQSYLDDDRSSSHRTFKTRQSPLTTEKNPFSDRKLVFITQM